MSRWTVEYTDGVRRSVEADRALVDGHLCFYKGSICLAVFAAGMWRSYFLNDSVDGQVNTPIYPAGARKP